MPNGIAIAFVCQNHSNSSETIQAYYAYHTKIRMGIQLYFDIGRHFADGIIDVLVDAITSVAKSFKTII
ncbi:MAG: hypothetical protein OCC49_06675 [Fibrobacterales bacterium]